jgi:hypothetical protein
MVMAVLGHPDSFLIRPPGEGCTVGSDQFPTFGKPAAVGRRLAPQSYAYCRLGRAKQSPRVPVFPELEARLVEIRGGTLASGGV